MLTVVATLKVKAGQDDALIAGMQKMQEFFRLAGGILDGRPDIAMYEEIDGKR